MQEILETYLKDEGLYDVIPEHRRRSLFSLPIASIWFVLLWLSVVYMVYRSKGSEGLLVAILLPVIVFIAIVIVLVVFYSLRRMRTGHVLTNKDAGASGMVIMIIFLLSLALAMGIYVNSWSTALIFLVVSFVLLVVVALMQMVAYRIHQLIENIRTVVRALGKSFGLLLVLIPLLLVIVILSVFSQELWQALGTLSAPRLIVSLICLVAPALVFVMASLNREASELVGAFPTKDQIVENAKNTGYIKEKLDKGLISQEEWSWLQAQLEWRIKLAETLLPIITEKTRQWLARLLALTSLTLVISFFFYFLLFFSVTLTPSLIESWVGVNGSAAILLATAKVSLILAVFIAVMASVYALTDENVKEIFTEWLKHKSRSWMVVSALYECVISPNYEVWEYQQCDEKLGRANVSIVVPKGLPDEAVEKACEHMEAKLDKFRNLVIVTAFEEKPDPVYQRGMAGNRWRLLYNKVQNIRSFEPIHLELDELRYQQFLGMDSLKEGTDIPDEWFGNTPQGIELAKSIWENDTDHEWILHPYIFQNKALVTAEISLAKRKSESDHYRQYVREVLLLARQAIQNASSIWIDLQFRDTIESLAHLIWDEGLPYIDYRDECIDKNRIEKSSAWE